eukprot:945238-Amphidinium_carterae.2
MICAKDEAKVHQCGFCLKPGHGASTCRGEASGSSGSKGKGKGPRPQNCLLSVVATAQDGGVHADSASEPIDSDSLGCTLVVTAWVAPTYLVCLVCTARQFCFFARKLGTSVFQTVDEIHVLNAQEHDLVDQENWTKLCFVGSTVLSRARRYDHGPRPLRRHEGRTRYGLADLTIEECKEVKTGTLLALRAIALMKSCMTSCTPFIFETPWPVDGSQSITLLDESSPFRPGSDIEWIRIDQCTFGAKTTKPTLLVGHMVNFGTSEFAPFRTTCPEQSRGVLSWASLLVWKLDPVEAPLTPGGPIDFHRLFTWAFFHLLREVEVSPPLASSSVIDQKKLQQRFHLPASKTDAMALGCWRSRGCICEVTHCQHACPFHASVGHLEVLRRRFAANRQLPIDLALFPDVNGQACRMQDVVDSLRALANSAGMDTEQVSHITGHAFRAIGARFLASVGLDIGVIMLAARWSSPIVYHYAREAPLMSITQAFKNKLSTSCFDATVAVEEMKEQLRSLECSIRELSCRVDSEASQPAALGDSLSALSTELSLIKSQLSAKPVTKFVINEPSGAVHLVAVDCLDAPSSAWRSVCGWRSVTCRFRLSPCAPSGLRTCAKCVAPCDSNAAIIESDEEV